MRNKKIAITIIGIVAAALVLTPILANKYADKPPKDENNSQQTPAANTGPRNNIELEGKVTCMKHRDPNAPATEECAFGFKADNGKYYELRNADGSAYDSEGLVNLSLQDSMTIRGVYHKLSDPNSKYLNEGTIDVTGFSLHGGDLPDNYSL